MPTESTPSPNEVGSLSKPIDNKYESNSKNPRRFIQVEFGETADVSVKKDVLGAIASRTPLVRVEHDGRRATIEYG